MYTVLIGLAGFFSAALFFNDTETDFPNIYFCRVLCDTSSASINIYHYINEMRYWLMNENERFFKKEDSKYTVCMYCILLCTNHIQSHRKRILFVLKRGRVCLYGERWKPFFSHLHTKIWIFNSKLQISDHFWIETWKSKKTFLIFWKN